MHNHDHDIIAALAEGVLEGSEASDATADIATCLECQSELDAQRLALSALSQAPTPGLSMQESAQMRRGVADALGLEEAPATRQRRPVPWAGLVTAAVVLVAVVAAAPLLNLLSTSGDDSADVVSAPAEARAEADVDELGVDDLAEENLAVEDFAAQAPSAGDASPAATEAPATTSASAESEAADAVPKLLAFGELTPEDLDSIRDGYASYRLSGSSVNPGTLFFTNQQLDDLNSRIGNLELSDALSPLPFCEVTTTDSWVYQEIGTGTFEGRQVLVFVGPFSDGEPIVILLDAETCQSVTSSSD